MPSDFELERIRERLRGRVPQEQNGPDIVRRAAVAAILRPAGEDTDVLFIRRAERLGDPWSGHMAFPGGHKDPTDADLLGTAIRETREEVGLDLNEHVLLGRLDDIPAVARGRFVGMAISPFVFALQGAPVLSPNYEVAELVWGRLGAMAAGETDDVKEFVHEGNLMRLPAYRVHGHVVWGLTHHMLRSLFATVAAGNGPRG